MHLNAFFLLINLLLLDVYVKVRCLENTQLMTISKEKFVQEETFFDNLFAYIKESFQILSFRTLIIII